MYQHDKDFSHLEEKISIKFANKDTLRQSMVHRSFLNENPYFPLGHNERLEFLGDAVLELVVTEFLYNNYPENTEGDMTNWRAALVNSKMLAKLANDQTLEEYLYLSHGEKKDANPKARQYILANAYEALIGAIYVDQGMVVVKDFIHKRLLPELPDILAHKLYMDPKTRFQEASQEKTGVTPTYKVLSESGPDHEKEFIVGIYIEDDLIAEGRGTSKQEAQVIAAEHALQRKGW